MVIVSGINSVKYFKWSIYSGFGTKHEERTSRFWIDSEGVDQETYDANVPNQTLYRKAIGENYRISYVYKDSQGQNLYY